MPSTRDPEFVENSLLNHNITDVIRYRSHDSAQPRSVHPVGEELIIVIHLGWIALGLSAYGLPRATDPASGGHVVCLGFILAPA